MNLKNFKILISTVVAIIFLGLNTYAADNNISPVNLNVIKSIRISSHKQCSQGTESEKGFYNTQIKNPKSKVQSNIPTQAQLLKLKAKPKSPNSKKSAQKIQKIKKNVEQYILEAKKKIEKPKEEKAEKKGVSGERKSFFYTARCGAYKYLSNAKSDRKVLQNIIGNRIPVFIEKPRKLYFLYAGSSQSKKGIESLISIIKKTGWKGCLLTKISTKHILKQSQSLIASDVFVPPEVPTKVIMSDTDVNRIVAPDTVKDVVFSKEKGLVVNFTNNNIFVKFLIKKDPDGKIKYVNTPSELYIVTGNTVYTIIAIPEKVSARTVRLMGSDLKNIQINQNMFAQLPYEERVVKLIKSVYTDKILASWTIKNTNKTYNNIISFLNIRLIKTVRIDGEGLKLKEYLVQIKPNSNLNKIDLDERLFLKPQLGKKIIAVSLSDLKLEKTDTVVLFIVEHVEDES